MKTNCALFSLPWILSEKVFSSDGNALPRTYSPHQIISCRALPGRHSFFFFFFRVFLFFFGVIGVFLLFVMVVFILLFLLLLWFFFSFFFFFSLLFTPFLLGCLGPWWGINVSFFRFFGPPSPPFCLIPAPLPGGEGLLFQTCNKELKNSSCPENEDSFSPFSHCLSFLFCLNFPFLLGIRWTQKLRGLRFLTIHSFPLQDFLLLQLRRRIHLPFSLYRD